MALLHKTKEALYGYYADLVGFERGVHELDEEAYGKGRVIRTEEFDPLKHDPSDINYLSLMGLVSKKPHVDVVLPKAPIDMQILTYHRQDDSDPRIKFRKQQLMHRLVEELIAARPAITDTVTLFDVGSITPEVAIEDSEPIETSTSAEAAQVIDDLCSDNTLSFILGDFADIQFCGPIEKAVAIVLNDPIDMSVQRTRRSTELRIGSSRAANLKRESDVVFLNQILGEFHQGLEWDLGLAGLAVAHAVYDPDLPDLFRVDEVDSSIANAIAVINGD